MIQHCVFSLQSLYNRSKPLVMAAPVTREFNLAVVCADPNLTRNDFNPNSAEDNFISSQLANVSNSQPHFPCDPSPSKRRKSMPTRFAGSRTDMQKENPSPKINIVVTDAPGPSSSLQKQKSPTNSFKDQVRSSPAMDRAVDLQSSLGVEFPSCIKMMLISHITHGFWMGLPVHFCKSFLPKENVDNFVLEDEDEKQWKVKYIACRHGFSAGWKKFAVEHNLEGGDVLLFQFVETNRLKVYILKGNYSDEVDGAFSLLHLRAHSEQLTQATLSHITKKNKHPGSLLTVVQEKVKKPRKSATPSRFVPPGGHLIEYLGNGNEEVGSQVLACSRPSEPQLSFQEVKSFEDFRIWVNGVSIDHDVDDARLGYYKLCSYKNEFLHPEGVNDKLAVGMIRATVNIVNEIKKCKPTTAKEEFEKWDKCLEAFEILGMKVGFLRDKIRTLERVLFESEGGLDIRQYVEATNESKRIKDELKKVAAKRKELMESAKKCEGILGILKQKVEKYELRFKEVVNAPW